MASEHYKKKEKTAIEVQEEYDLAIRRMREAQAKYNPVEFFSAERRRTNADRIRAMSDEELARWIWAVQSGVYHENIVSTDGWLDWLKSSAEREK